MDYYLSLISFGPHGWGRPFLEGAFVTLSLAVATLPFGLTLGLAIALMQRSHRRFARGFATVYTTVFRGAPELLTLYIIYFGLSLGVQSALKSLGFSTQFDMPPFLAGMIALGLVLAAFSSEVWVGALNAIPRGQREAAAALGLHRAQAFRLIVFPQIMRIALPGLGNNWMVLLKETSLVSVITLPDIMFYAMRANVVTKEPFLMFGVASLIYLAFSIISAVGFGVLEARSNRGHAMHGAAR
ncbi:MAG: ABC transporter permease [Rhizobiales bacterium 65-9]|nr:ABC transporter permease subunit [Hyphomicrobiales bacterium]OJY33248.1 MAG: ABC transporter permease [Rhizobiales bacterium 65-9]